MMLRHIVSVSLAMTVCAAFIPTKVNAATLSIRSNPRTIRGEIVAKPGDLIDFIFSLRLEKDTVVRVIGSVGVSDSSELVSLTGPQYLVSQDAPLSYDAKDPEIDIIRERFRVIKPVRDQIGDVFRTLSYEESGSSGVFNGLSISGSGADVVPVPEPLTIFGTAIGLGCGVLFKRKSSKKTVS